MLSPNDPIIKKIWGDDAVRKFEEKLRAIEGWNDFDVQVAMIMGVSVLAIVHGKTDLPIMNPKFALMLKALAESMIEGHNAEKMIKEIERANPSGEKLN